ncbi:hypothetical protein N9N28_11870 [Rubripirellula amarantea]|nr:hypothetical protein [Rubripirellula amarantea]
MNENPPPTEPTRHFATRCEPKHSEPEHGDDQCCEANITETNEGEPVRNQARFQLSLREYIGLLTIAMLGMGLFASITRLRSATDELARLRAETGYLSDTEAGQIAAARAPSDQPLTYRVRIRVPTPEVGSPPLKYRLAYSSVWPRNSAKPAWFGAVSVPPGESLVTLRVMEDPRDDRWKISALISSESGNKRMATALPPNQVRIFRGSHDVISTGIPRGQTFAAAGDQTIRVLDERWLVGEGSLMLYGDKPPEEDQIGIYAELQPDLGTL